MLQTWLRCTNRDPGLDAHRRAQCQRVTKRPVTRLLDLRVMTSRFGRRLQVDFLGTAAFRQKAPLPQRPLCDPIIEGPLWQLFWLCVPFGSAGSWTKRDETIFRDANLPKDSTVRPLSLRAALNDVDFAGPDMIRTLQATRTFSPCSHESWVRQLRCF